MLSLLWKGALAALVGSGIGIWFIWQDARDEHMFAMYDCSHAYHDSHPDISLEEAYIHCEKEAR